jgi:hypothetical protein
MTVLIDETTSPGLRAVLGRLLATAERADFAVMNVRLAGVDLTPGEAGGIRACRFLLGRLDAASLPQQGADPLRMRGLRALVAAGRIEIRSAGLASWTPDFSVFRGVPGNGDASDVCVIGAHYFGMPPAATGPSLTCILSGARAVALAARRFEALWERAHDVSTAVIDAIDRLLEQEAGAGAGALR